jgi:hypothetical protein
MVAGCSVTTLSSVARASRVSWRSISASSSATRAPTIRPISSPLATASTSRAASRRASCSLRSASALSRDRSFESRAHSSAKPRRAASITAGFLSSSRRPPSTASSIRSSRHWRLLAQSPDSIEREHRAMGRPRCDPAETRLEPQTPHRRRPDRMRRGGTPFQPEFAVRALASRSAVSCQSSSGTMRKCGASVRRHSLRGLTRGTLRPVCGLRILPTRFQTMTPRYISLQIIPEARFADPCIVEAFQARPRYGLTPSRLRAAAMSRQVWPRA